MFDLIYDFLINNFLGTNAANDTLKIELAQKLSWFTTIAIFFIIFYFIYVLIKIIFDKGKWNDF